MTDVLNNIIAFKVLYMLVTPFVDTDAYKLGIIDENGKNLIKPSKFTKYEQKEAYSYLHRLVFNMKRILAKLPGGDNKLKSLTAALYLVKEYYETKDKSLNLMEDRFNDLLKKDVILAEEYVAIEKFVENLEYCDACDRLKKDCICAEAPVKEEGGAGGAPANATGAAVSTDRTVIKKKDVDQYKLKNIGALKFVRRKPNVAA